MEVCWEFHGSSQEECDHRPTVGKGDKAWWGAPLGNTWVPQVQSWDEELPLDSHPMHLWILITRAWCIYRLMNCLSLTDTVSVSVRKKGFPGVTSGKEPTCQCRRPLETQVQSLGQEDPLEKIMVTHSSILAGESHGQRSLAGYSPWSHKVGVNWSNLAGTHLREWNEAPMRLLFPFQVLLQMALCGPFR